MPGITIATGWLVSLGSATLMFLALYRVVPNRPLTLRQVWPGAALAGVLFVLLSQAFPLYLRIFGGTYTAYKTLGLFLLLMTWVYCLALVTVLGAELNAFRCGHGALPDPESPIPLDAATEDAPPHPLGPAPARDAHAAG